MDIAIYFSSGEEPARKFLEHQIAFLESLDPTFEVGYSPELTTYIDSTLKSTLVVSDKQYFVYNHPVFPELLQFLFSGGDHNEFVSRLNIIIKEFRV